MNKYPNYMNIYAIMFKRKIYKNYKLFKKNEIIKNSVKTILNCLDIERSIY